MIPWVTVRWIGGPHDGLVQGVLPGGDLPTARVCTCHGALYMAEPFEDEWRLIHTERWVANPVEADEVST